MGVVAVLLAAGLASCALDWSYSRIEVDGGRSDASVDGGRQPGSDGSLDPPDTAQETDAAQAADGAGDARPDTGSGCHSNADCAPTSFCHYKDHLCGTGAAGACIPRPSGCPASSPYACTCNGTVDISGPCNAESNGNDPTTRTCASPPPGTQCGYVYCITACLQGTNADGEATFDCQ